MNTIKRELLGWWRVGGWVVFAGAVAFEQLKARSAKGGAR